MNGQFEEFYALFQADGGNSSFAELLRMFNESASSHMEMMEIILCVSISSLAFS